MSYLYKNKIILLSLLFLASNRQCYSQSSAFFAKRGNNISDLSCGGILYAPIQNKYHQAFGAGAVWVKKPIDLRQPFSVRFILEYTDTTGVDGSAFVFQTDTNSVGEAFNGLGYRKIDKSIAITFDPVNNKYDNDPDYDHIAIQANGDLDHASANNIAGPKPLEPFYSISASPGDPPVVKFHRLITVEWDPATTTLSASIDGAVYISVTSDIVQKIFGGNSIVYWGFTGSNTQSIVYPPTKELTFGYTSFFFGDVFPRYTTNPILDTCFGKPIQFFDSSLYKSDYSLQDLSLFKWYWNFGDGTSSTDRNPPPHYFPKPGYYELKFTATNQLGCTTDTLKRIIRLGSIPKPDFATDALCTNSSIQFTDSTITDAGMPVAWWWDFGNGDLSRDKKPITTFTIPGIKTVHLTVSTEFGCKADTSKTIVLTDKPSVDFTYTKDCEGIATFASVITNNVPVKNWYWNFGDNTTSTIANPVHHFVNNDSYHNSMIAVSQSGCISDTVKKDIVINKVYPSAGNDTIIAVGQPLQLNASGGTIYSWSPVTGLDNSSIKNPIAILSGHQVYFLLVKNEDGCEGRDTIKIKVYSGPELYVPTAFTPDRNGLNDLFRITVPGLKQLYYIRIFDRWGNLVFQTSDIHKGWDGALKGVDQPTGTYVWIVKAIDYKGNTLFKKGTVTLIR
jgi:gliding motility-associated-like protein